MTSVPFTTDTIQEWLVSRVAWYMEATDEEVDPHEDITQYGMDSLHKEELALDIADQYGIELDAEQLRSQTTIHGIATVLHSEMQRKAGG
jgi:acyl carrier protein